MAASQCPKCSHLFEVRDGFGELLPLSFCSSCQSYYPAHVGSCKWCGTTPEPVRKPLPWTHIGVGGLIATAWLAGVLLRDPRGKSHARSSAQSRARSQSKSVRDDSVLQVVAIAPSDTFGAKAPADTSVVRDTIAAWTNIDPATPPAEVPTAVPPEQIVVQSGARASRSVRLAAAPSSSPIVSQPVVATSAPVVTTPTVYPPAPAAYPTAPVGSRTQPFLSTPKSRASSHWVNLVAKNWIIVRTDASQDAHIVASVGPQSRVQLGEVRGSWRRIRSRDIFGWVDLRRATFAEVRGSSRAGGLASRY
jgi:hypothetical protein